MNLLDMAKDLINIYEDIIYRVDTANYDIYDFDQTWASTALGFGGMGGQKITTARTYVLIPKYNKEKAYVYFGGRYAYKCHINDRFRDDLFHHRMASVMEMGRYER